MLEAHNSHAAKVRFPVLTEALIAGPLSSKSIWTPALKAFLVVIGSLLLATSAQFKIPLYPVPVTGQTLVVLLIGMVYGPRLGGVTIAAYLLQGVIGLPVFAGGAFGIATLLGPTGGYLGGISDRSYCCGRSRGAWHGPWHYEHYYCYDDWKR